MCRAEKLTPLVFFAIVYLIIEYLRARRIISQVVGDLPAFPLLGVARKGRENPKCWEKTFRIVLFPAPFEPVIIVRRG